MIIEKVNRAGAVLDHYQFNGQSIRIGRAYDNDLILHDPYVEGSHVVLVYDPEQDLFHYHDQNTLNGTQVIRDKSNERDAREGILYSGDSICIGKTLLKVRSRVHEVPRALPISFWDKFLSLTGSWSVVVLASLLVVLLEVLHQYLSDPRIEKINGKIFNSANELFIVGVYAAFWSMIARVQRHESRTLVHAGIGAWLLVALSAQTLLQPVLIYNFDLFSFQSVVNVIFSGVFIFLAGFASLYLATDLKLPKRLLFALIVPAGLLLTQMVNYFQRPEFVPWPDYDHVIVSPAWQWTSPIDEYRFIQDSAELYDRALENLEEDAGDTIPESPALEPPPEEPPVTPETIDEGGLSNL